LYASHKVRITEMITVFSGANIFVGDGRIIDQGSVVVEDGHILKVTEKNISIPAKARSIDLGGYTILPGFIDCHVHLCCDGSPNPIEELLKSPDAVIALKGEKFARQTLLSGITSVRDMGGYNGVDLILRDAIRSGMIQGPRMLASGSIICMTGGQAWQIAREADGPDEVCKAAREQIKAGVDIIKFMATGGILTPGVEPDNAQFSVEELHAGIQEAHKAGRRTAAHAQGTQGILNALRAGIDSIEHGIFLNEEVVSWMGEHNIPLIPTLSALYNIEAKGEAGGIPSFAVEKVHRAMPAHLESVRLARESGIPVAAGTDAGTPYNVHGDNLRELELLVKVGFSPLEALCSGTQIAAQVLGWDDHLGTIEEGKFADLVVVEGDPVEDITLLQREECIRWVMQGGRFFKEDGKVRI
jgi:imidazolonepropionase-like amidohydrolase